ncbi:hypothetical protein CTI12_AA552680 [Artemisia annua]|uniref:Cytochrome P450 n=1 Tax=Artemisia annua TaxID=35608 RepID=A0A2U1KX81_ARTAN|nr:hypothetical protein CTI12_AA552680 [Artemisia annua]
MHQRVSALATANSSNDGHKPYPFITSLISFHHNSHRLIHWFTHLLSLSPSQTIAFEQLGPKNQMIITANPTNIEHMLKTNFRNYPKGTPFTDVLGDFLGMGIFNVDGELWSTQRKLASHEFSTKSLREFAVNVLEEEIITRLIPLLDMFSKNNEVLDMQDVLRRRVSALATANSSNDGHKPYPFITSLISFHHNSHRLIHWFTHLLSLSPSQTIAFEQLGPKNQMIITANPTNIEHMLKTNFRNYPKGTPFTDVLGDFLGMGIFNVDGELWSTQRKLASHEFSTKSLREFAVNVLEEEIITRLIPLLDMFSKNNEVLDMQDVLRRLAFDTICKISLGWDPCFLDFTRSVSPLAAAFDVAAEATAMRGKVAAKWIWKVKKLLNVGSERKLKEAVGVIHFAVNDIIRKRRENMDGSESQKDLLSRLYPPVVWDSKHAAENDVLPDGTPVYKGNRVMYFPYGMGRMEQLWGKDCLEFRPDRWFSELGVFKMENPYKFAVFQAGPRVCLGKEMAFMQMKYVVASVLRRFELVPVSLDQPVFVPLLTAHMDGGLKVRVRKRRE